MVQYIRPKVYLLEKWDETSWTNGPHKTRIGIFSTLEKAEKEIPDWAKTKGLVKYSRGADGINFYIFEEEVK